MHARPLAGGCVATQTETPEASRLTRAVVPMHTHPTPPHNHSRGCRPQFAHGREAPAPKSSNPQAEREAEARKASRIWDAPVAARGSSECGKPRGRPVVYIYPLNASFRERGFRNCIGEDCAFGTKEEILGTTYHHSETHELLWMVLKRLLEYPCRTKDPTEAELFFVPAWSHGAVPADRRGKKAGFHDPTVRPSACIDETFLLAELVAINPLVTADSPLYAAARRHIKMDVHSNIHCEFFSRNDPKPVGWFPKTSIEIRTSRGGTPWYALPYPSMYHGAAAAVPAIVHRQDPAKKKYLWSYSGSAHGAGKQLRQVLDEECKVSDRCHGHFKPKGAGYLKECGGNLFNTHLDRRHGNGCVAMMDVPDGAKNGTKKSARIMPMLVDVIQNSVFCAQPEGDSKSRKGLIDSIILGCIPIVFDSFQETMYVAPCTCARVHTPALPAHIQRGRRGGGGGGGGGTRVHVCAPLPRRLHLAASHLRSATRLLARISTCNSYTRGCTCDVSRICPVGHQGT